MFVHSLGLLETIQVALFVPMGTYKHENRPIHGLGTGKRQSQHVCEHGVSIIYQTSHASCIVVFLFLALPITLTLALTIP